MAKIHLSTAATGGWGPSAILWGFLCSQTDETMCKEQFLALQCLETLLGGLNFMARYFFRSESDLIAVGATERQRLRTPSLI